MLCKTCKKEMLLIKDSETRKIFFCQDCDLFLDIDSVPAMEELTGKCAFLPSLLDSCWKSLQDDSMFMVTFWTGNNKYCKCHRRIDVSIECFYSLEEAKGFATHFMADGEVKDGNVLPDKFKDRGIVSIRRVGEEDYYVKEEIDMMTRIEVERRMSDGG